MIAKLHSLNSIQLLILTKLNLLMFTFEPIQNPYRVQSNLFDCTIIAMFPILYFRYSIAVVTIAIVTIAIVTILYTIVLSHVITITIRF